MRIILKPQYKGYTPVLDPFSKEKIVWIKIKVKRNGPAIVATYITCIAPIVIFSFWAANLRDSQDNINIYRDLGHDKFILIFTIAIIIGIAAYIWFLFINDSNKIKKITPTESLKRYKQAPVISKEQQKQMKGFWKTALALVAFYIFGFWVLFWDSTDFRLTGACLGAAIFLAIAATTAALFYLTMFFARKYVNHKFNIKSNNKKPLPKKKGK